MERFKIDRWGQLCRKIIIPQCQGAKKPLDAAIDRGRVRFERNLEVAGNRQLAKISAFPVP